MTPNDPLKLTLTLDGPLVEEHRLPLSELLRIGKQLRDSLRDVAVVLTHHGPSGTGGRAKKVIEQSVDLRVVAAPQPGSFVLELEAPPESPPEQAELPTDLGPALVERTVTTFLDGIELLNRESEQLPTGFDRGVLRAIVPFRTALRKGLSEINLRASDNGHIHKASITQAKIETAERLIQQPVRAETAAEGVLQMVDFSSLECRIDRPDRPSVTVYFDERHRDVVHDAVRQYVRVAGEGQFEPESNEPSKIWASSIEVVYESLEFDIQAFWREKDVEQLAEERQTPAYSLPEELDTDPWRSDEDAAALIEAIHATD